MDTEVPKTFYAQIDKEHQEIDDQITLLEEVTRQHFENDAKLLELQNKVKSDDLNHLLETHKKYHQELLESIESIATEFRDHIRLEDWYQSHKI